jgi:hypothetical protein
MKKWTSYLQRIVDRTFVEKPVNPIFYETLNDQLANDFEKKVGLNPQYLNYFFEMSVEYSYYEPFQYNEDENIGRMDVNIMSGSFCTPAVIRWVSKSGKIYKPTSPDIDPKDIYFYFESILQDYILKEWNSVGGNTKRIGFSFKKTNFELELMAFGKLDGFYIHVKINSNLDYERYFRLMSKKIAEIFNAHNQKSEAKKRKYGIVVDFSISRIEKDIMVYYIDLGTAIGQPLKTLIDVFNHEFNEIEKVVFTNKEIYPIVTSVPQTND